MLIFPRGGHSILNFRSTERLSVIAFCCFVSFLRKRIMLVLLMSLLLACVRACVRETPPKGNLTCLDPTSEILASGLSCQYDPETKLLALFL